MRKQNSGIQPTTKKIAALKLNYSLNASEKTEQHHHDSSDEDEEVQFSELHNFLNGSITCSNGARFELHPPQSNTSCSRAVRAAAPAQSEESATLAT